MPERIRTTSPEGIDSVPEYQTLRDGFRNAVGEEYVEGLVWVYRSGERIEVYAHPEFSVHLAKAQRNLADARSRGISDEEIWAHRCEANDVHGYSDMRWGPFTVEGESSDKVGTKELHGMMARRGVWYAKYMDV
jgi:hypothetical protein